MSQIVAIKAAVTLADAARQYGFVVGKFVFHSGGVNDDYGAVRVLQCNAGGVDVQFTGNQFVHSVLLNPGNRNA